MAEQEFSDIELEIITREGLRMIEEHVLPGKGELKISQASIGVFQEAAFAYIDGGLAAAKSVLFSRTAPAGMAKDMRLMREFMKKSGSQVVRDKLQIADNVRAQNPKATDKDIATAIKNRDIALARAHSI